MRRALQWQTAVLTFLLLTAAHARTPRGAVLPVYYAQLSWLAPTQFAGGGTITDQLTFNVYASVNGAPLTVIASNIPGVTYFDTSSNLVHGNTVCYAVTAVDSGAESARSSQVCKTF